MDLVGLTCRCAETDGVGGLPEITFAICMNT